MAYLPLFFALFAFLFIYLPAFCPSPCLLCSGCLLLVLLPCLVLFVLVVFVVVSLSLTDYTQKERAQRFCPLCPLFVCYVCLDTCVVIKKFRCRCFGFFQFVRLVLPCNTASIRRLARSYFDFLWHYVDITYNRSAFLK